MKLYIKEKFFSIGNKFFVKDEFEQDRFYIEKPFMSLTFYVYDISGRCVAAVKQRFLTLTFDIETGGSVAATVRKRFGLFAPIFDVLGTNWRLEGDFWAHEYALLDNQSVLMRLYKEWFVWGDSYVMDIGDEKNELMCLCMVLAVDAVLGARRTSST